ncbi:MAG TPA: serine/threonine-protein kinase [Gemmataceae bacterium]|nr:serine/threonine-protein kinase [Gemmataceae bacterium]
MTDRDLFIAALEHSDPAERAAWLDEACAGDAECRRRVDVLLHAHEEASRFLASPAVLPSESADATRTARSRVPDQAATEADVRALLSPSEKPGHLGTLDHYDVLEIVGKGGMGVVLKAFDPRLHRLVALKVMAPHLAAHGAARSRFEREARAVAAVRNEHVVAIHAVEMGGTTPYLVMEFVGGISLQDRLERRGPLKVKEILRIGMQAAHGLAAAHKQGIVHRDIKPANILLENGVERVRITDFGLARAADDVSLTQSGMIAGTPNYMSPEQAIGSATTRSDLFSLGSVLYALCVGHPPFRADTPLAVLRRVCEDQVRPIREVNADIPDWLDAIVRKLLAKDPAERFQTADEIAGLLGQHLAHLQQPTAVAMPAAVIVPLSAIVRPDPHASRRAGPGCLAAFLFFLGPGLLVAFRDTFWEGFIRPGYWVPVYMLGLSGVLLFIQWWGRGKARPGWESRRWNVAIVILVGSTATALIVSWQEIVHGDKLSRAFDWHTGGLILSALIVNLPALGRFVGIGKKPELALHVEPQPHPLRHRRTAFALIGGSVALTVGFITSAMLREAHPEDESLVQAFVLGVWGSLAIVCFGPGTFVAREAWRRRAPSDRTGDRWALVLGGLGVILTMTAEIATIWGSPYLRHEFFGDV